MKIGKAIRIIREHQGLTQVQLAKRSRISQASISGIENGNRPNKANFQSICKVLNVSEALIYTMGMEKGDVKGSKASLYDELFPIIQDLILKLAK